MRIRQLNHCMYQLQYHLVWGTKYRRKILKHYVRMELIGALLRVQHKYPDWYIVQVNTGEDHVHLLLEIPPKYSISEVVQKLKSQTSADLTKKFKFIEELYDDGNVWGVGYFASSVGLNEEQIKNYIEKQNQLELGKDITAEFE